MGAVVVVIDSDDHERHLNDCKQNAIRLNMMMVVFYLHDKITRAKNKIRNEAGNLHEPVKRKWNVKWRIDRIKSIIEWLTK